MGYGMAWLGNFFGWFGKGIPIVSACTFRNCGVDLLDARYIGTNTMFDQTSHHIDYNILNEEQIEFHHVDWGYKPNHVENEIDTIAYKKYVLTVSKNGKIAKK